MAASGCARRTLLRSFPAATSPANLFNRGINSLATSPTPTFSRLSRRKLPFNISRLPEELGCVQSLMPLHSVTASALLTSMLSLKPGSWAWLSEGFATPL